MNQVMDCETDTRRERAAASGARPNEAMHASFNPPRGTRGRLLTEAELQLWQELRAAVNPLVDWIWCG